MIQDIDRGIDILCGQGGEASKAIRPLLRHRGHFLIKIPRHQTALFRRQVIAEDRGVNRHHLHVHPVGIHVL